MKNLIRTGLDSQGSDITDNLEQAPLRGAVSNLRRYKCPFLVGEPYYYNWFLNVVNPICNQFKDISFKMALLEWMEDESVHTSHYISFKHLFTLIMTIVENHTQKEIIKQRLIKELKNSIESSSSGRFTFMVDALIGFVDGIMDDDYDRL